MDALTPAVVDALLKGRCAATLRSANLSCVPALGPAEVLKLVKGCPALRTVAWELAGEGGDWGRVTAAAEPAAAPPRPPPPPPSGCSVGSDASEEDALAAASATV